MSRFELRIGRLPRRWRRLIAVASLLGLPAAYAWTGYWLTTSAPKAAWGVVTFALMGASLAGAVVLYAYVRDRANMGAVLDERQRQLRDRAMVLAYQVLSTVVSLAVIGVGITVIGFGRNIVLDGSVVVALVISAGVLLPLLPSATLAWIEPDALDEA